MLFNNTKYQKELLFDALLSGGIYLLGNDVMFSTVFAICFLIVLIPLNYWLEINGYKEPDNGCWYNGGIKFSPPVIVFSKSITKNDDGKEIIFKVKNAPPNSFVQFDVSYFGGWACVSIGHQLGNVGLGMSTNYDLDKLRKRNYSVTINENRETKLYIRTRQDSDDTHIDIKMISWKR